MEINTLTILILILLALFNFRNFYSLDKNLKKSLNDEGVKWLKILRFITLIYASIYALFAIYLVINLQR